MKKNLNVSFSGKPLTVHWHVYVHVVSAPSCPSAPSNSSFTNQDGSKEISPFRYIHVTVDAAETLQTK